MRCLGFLLVIVGLVIGCRGDESHIDPTTGGPARSATFGPPSENRPADVSAGQVRFLSYNVLLGAGADPSLDVYLRDKEKYGGRSRLPELIDFIRSSNADIVGIQEASGWTSGSPSIVEQVAADLGMNYYLAEAPQEFHLVLLSKFEIVWARNLSSELGTNGGLLAEIQLPDGEPLHVFVVHFDPNSVQRVACQVSEVHKQSEPLWGQRIVLMGDVNVSFATLALQQMSKSGWMLLADEGIDQIWTAPVEEWSVTASHIELTTPDQLSDHPPVMADISYSHASTDPAPVFQPMTEDACSAPPPPSDPLVPLATDRVVIDSLLLDEALKVASVSADFALPSPSTEGITAFDFALTPGYGGVPGRGNLTLVAPEGGAFKSLSTIQRNGSVLVTYQGAAFSYRVLAICRASRESFFSLFYGTEIPMLTLFSAPVGDEFVYVVAELRPGSLPQTCTTGKPV